MQRRDAGIATFAAIVLLLGCTPKHTNMLIFGTDSKIALDVSGSPTSGSPQITIGWRRNELALVPLLSNAPTTADLSWYGSTGNCGQGDDGCGGGAGELFQAKDQNGSVTHTDAYSTIASFGANLDASASTAASAKGAIATFFATGVAAQKLAEQGGARLVSTAPTAGTDHTFTTDASRMAMEQGLEKNPNCAVAVRNWMKSNNITDGLTVFVYDSVYDKQRSEALKDATVKSACA